MERIEYTDPESGRKYAAYSNGTDNVIIGPPLGLVDTLLLPEPFATRLHNILYDRGLLNYKEASKGSNLMAALQEALLLDVQKLLEAYFKFES